MMVEASAGWNSLPQMMLEIASKRPERPMSRFWQDGGWRQVTWGEFGNRVAAVAAGLRAAGVGPGERVLLVSENRPEFVIADTALMAIGAVTVPTYTTNAATDHAHILRDSGARVAIVSTSAFARRVLEGAALADGLDLLIGMEDAPVEGAPRQIAWATLEATPASLDALMAEVEQIPTGRLACLVYTSGTGGLPRGVMLPHRAMLANREGVARIANRLELDGKAYLSFLPLSHSYEHTVGGFLLPYFRRLGRPIPDFDFSVPGVTSMSMDFHKYAFAAKGASVVLYRSKDLRKYQIYACSNWTGYTIINPTVQSTKSAGPLAAAWAVLHFFGEEGYLQMARQVLDATQRIAAAVEAMPDLRLLGRPDMNLVAFTSDTVSVFHVIDEMKQLGWYVQPQLAYGNSKENIHLSINPASVRWVDAMLADLAKCVAKAKTMKSGDLAAAVTEAFGSIDPSTLTEETFGEMLGMAGIQGTALPERMAGINEILNALPVALRERLLVEYLNDLYQHRS